MITMKASSLHASNPHPKLNSLTGRDLWFALRCSAYTESLYIVMFVLHAFFDHEQLEVENECMIECFYLVLTTGKYSLLQLIS